MADWFKKWSKFDSARSLGEWVAWAVLGVLGTSLAAVMAAAAAYTHWYWEAYGPVGVAFAFIVSIAALSLCALATGGAVLLAVIAKNMRASPSASLSLEKPEGAQARNQPATTLAGVDRISQLIVDLDSRLEGLSASVEQLRRSSPNNDQFSNLSNNIEAERSARKRDIDGIGKSISGIRSGVSHIQTELQAFRERVQTVFHAKRVLSSYENITIEIESFVERMSDPLSKPETYTDWRAWSRDMGLLRSMLGVFCNVVMPFQEVRKELFDTPGEEYREDKWKFDFSGMSDGQKHDYKTFRILYKNFSEACDVIGPKIRDAAAAIP